jgi:hypothetical protein
LIDATEVFNASETPACCASIWLAALLNCLARSPTRASVVCRAEASCGLLATSTKELSACCVA